MIEYELNEAERILTVRPLSPLESSDFEELAEKIDPFLEEGGPLNGLMINTESFPGWDHFGAMITHLKFVKNHHHEIKKVAAVTNSTFLTIMPQIVNHFISAEVRHFDYADQEAALNWIRGEE